MCTKALKEAVVPVIKQTAFMLQLLKSTAMNILRGGGGGCNTSGKANIYCIYFLRLNISVSSTLKVQRLFMFEIFSTFD